MAILKNTSILQGNKNLTVLNMPLHISSSQDLTTFDDTLNSNTISYLPYGTGYNQISLFQHSQDLEIGKVTDSSQVTKLYLYSASLNFEAEYNNAAGIRFDGWSSTTSTTIGFNTFYDYYYTEKARFNLKKTASGDYTSTFEIYLSDQTTPTTSTKICSFSNNKIEFLKEISLLNKGQASISGSLHLERYSGGNRNLASRLLFVVTDKEQPYTGTTYYGESGLAIQAWSKTYTEEFYGDGYVIASAGSAVDRYQYRYDFKAVHSLRPAFLHIYRPASSTTTSKWQITPSPTEVVVFSWGDNSSYLGEPSWWNTGANKLQMNFTGQHWNKPLENLSFYEDKIGLIVISNGDYLDIDGANSITINQALPNVTLSTKRKQKNIYGVVSRIESIDSEERIMGFNSWKSVLKKKKGEDNSRLIVNSIGEGAVWICNINGNLENGDFITTCEIPGFGMKQDTNRIANYTVAKITCDCDFDLNSPIYICEEFEWQGQTYKKAFVGCTYHCG